MITFIQRAGSALNLNVHFHILVPDGAYTFEHGKPQFHRVSPPSPTELRQLLDTVDCAHYPCSGARRSAD